MSNFEQLIRFESVPDKTVFFADIGSGAQLPQQGALIQAYRSYDQLVQGHNNEAAAFGRLLAPVPDPELPIYCVGLNYKSHAAEAKLRIPQYPPLWTKPKAALAHPDEDIPINQFCSKNMLDYEGEFVFITSKECRDLSPAEAQSHILGYTVGNDLSCRTFQLPGAAGGQFFYAKAFDKFAPLGPSLLSAAAFDRLGDDVELTTRVNGQIRQRTRFTDEWAFRPAEILSHMSQGTTIPAFTAVMTGTPAGVGLFMGEKGTFLKDGDVVEVELSGIAGVLRNKVVFE